jgi:hypothetical protein
MYIEIGIHDPERNIDEFTGMFLCGRCDRISDIIDFAVSEKTDTSAVVTFQHNVAFLGFERSPASGTFKFF